MTTPREPPPAPKQRQQTEDDVTPITAMQAVRLRPGLYVRFGPDTIYDLIDNVLDYSLEEVMASRCNRLGITIHSDGSITISDNGSGLPVVMYPERNMSALELELTTLVTPGPPRDSPIMYLVGCTVLG